MEDSPRRYERGYGYGRYYRPSFFLPILLIVVGIIWLLVNNGTIPVENVYRLIPLWPVLLIVAGVGLIFRRIWWPLSLLTWAAAAIAVVWLLLNPGLLPKTAAPVYRHDTYHEPLDGAKSAAINLDLSINRAEISALSGPQDLINADLYHLGNINFGMTGSDIKNVRLSEDLMSSGGFMRWDLMATGDTTAWKIGLTPQIPLAVNVSGGTGSADMDLSGLKIQSLSIDGGTGSKKVLLPAGSSSFPFNLNGGTGSVTITVPANTAFDLTSNGGTGSLHINLPAGAAAQVDVHNGGLGSLHLGPDFKKVSGNTNDKEGVYETPSFAGAKSPIRITLDIGTGSVTIR